MTLIVRLARTEEAEALPSIERSAGEAFRALPDLAALAHDEPTSVEEYLDCIAAGTVWLAQQSAGAIVGVVLAERIDDELHIWEFAVRHDLQGQGIGRRLFATVIEDARAARVKAITLTTFRDVAWNAPFYARLGFKSLAGAAIAPRLSAILEAEAARGLSSDRRCAMSYEFRRGHPRAP